MESKKALADLDLTYTTEGLSQTIDTIVKEHSRFTKPEELKQYQEQQREYEMRLYRQHNGQPEPVEESDDDIEEYVEDNGEVYQYSAPQDGLQELMNLDNTSDKLDLSDEEKL